MWTLIAQFVGAAVSVASLTFAVVTQVRTSSQRKHAERAETAGRLLASLHEIDVGGISPKLDDSLALKLHGEQVHGLQEIIRINIAEFERRAKRAGIPLTLHILVGVYGLLVLTIAFGTVEGVGRTRADQRWVSVLIVAAIFILGIGMVLDLVLATARRITARAVRRRAGIYVPSDLEILSKVYVRYILWRQRRRAGRAQSDPEGAS
ncbi:MAG: hypothetical protein JWM49_2043 [Microbacteriaceae bacterium]|nr:hypothetical protein [Microbacteriaceae bacterium]